MDEKQAPRALDDPDPAVRKAAALSALEDPDPRVRQAAASTVGGFGTGSAGDPAASRALCRALVLRSWRRGPGWLEAEAAARAEALRALACVGDADTLSELLPITAQIPLEAHERVREDEAPTPLRSALEGIVARAGRPAAAALLCWLRPEHGDAAVTAAQVLGTLRHDEAEEPIAALLCCEDMAARTDRLWPLLRALSAIGERPASVARDEAKRSRSTRDRLRNRIWRREDAPAADPGHGDAAAGKRLRKALLLAIEDDASATQARESFRVLGEGAVVRSLALCLRDLEPPPLLEAATAFLLADLGVGESELLEALVDPLPLVRQLAAAGLRSRAEQAEPRDRPLAAAPERLVRAAQDPDARVRREAVAALGSIGSGAAGALCHALADPDPRVRAAVWTHSIVDAGRRAELEPDEMAALARGLGFPDTVLSAASALAGMGRGLAPLLKAMESYPAFKANRIGDVVAENVAAFTSRPEIEPEARQAIASPHPRAAELARRVLAGLEGGPEWQALLAGLHAPDAGARADAVLSLHRTKRPAAIELVKKALREDPAREVRRCAAMRLGLDEPQDVLQCLGDALLAEQDEWVGAQIVTSLLQLVGRERLWEAVEHELAARRGTAPGGSSAPEANPGRRFPLESVVRKRLFGASGGPASSPGPRPSAPPVRVVDLPAATAVDAPRSVPGQTSPAPLPPEPTLSERAANASVQGLLIASRGSTELGRVSYALEELLRRAQSVVSEDLLRNVLHLEDRDVMLRGGDLLVPSKVDFEEAKSLAVAELTRRGLEP